MTIFRAEMRRLQSSRHEVVHGLDQSHPEDLQARHSFPTQLGGTLGSGIALARLTARLRSLLTLGLADRIAEAHASTLALHERLQRIEDDIVALRSIVRTRDDRAQKKLKSAMSSLVNLVSILPRARHQGADPALPAPGF